MPDPPPSNAAIADSAEIRHYRIAFGIGWTSLFLCAILATIFHLIFPDSNSETLWSPVSFILFATQDIWWLWIAVIALPLIWWMAQHCERRLTRPAPFANVFLAVLITLFTWAGSALVYRDFALSMDEFMMVYQSAIFQSGYLVASVDPDSLSIARALRPGFLIVDAELGYWAPGYRPGTALLHALFSMVGLGKFMMPFFCGVSVLLTAAIARRVLPEQPSAAVWAPIFLVTSTQFLLTGMTAYTMTAHLAASLLWLYLFSQDRTITHTLAIMVGAFALGLHQINVHAMFALPFLLHLAIWRGRWRCFMAYVVCYTLALGLWIFWMDIAAWLQGLEQTTGQAAQGVDGATDYVGHAVDSGLSRQSWDSLTYWAMNFSRFFAWQNLVLLPFCLAALFHWRDMPVFLKLIAAAVATTLLPYLALMPDQGHGWGYRYLHPVLGNLAILAAFGLCVAGPTIAGGLRHLALMAAVLMTVIALPYRAYQVNAFLTPFERTITFLTQLEADLVLIDAGSIWYGNDLVRNDPFLRNTPLILSVDELTVADLQRVCAARSAVFIEAPDLRQFGIKGRPISNSLAVNTAIQKRELLAEAKCIE